MSGGLYRYLSIHCSIIFWFEIIIQQEDDRSNGIVERIRQNPNLALIRQGCRNFLDVLNARMFHGETNPKGLMFMSMVMGQIDAIEAGTSQEEAIFESATKSIRSSYETLKSRLRPGDIAVLETVQQREGGVVGSGNGELQDVGYDFLQDGNLPVDFEFPDSLLFTHIWDENCWVV